MRMPWIMTALSLVTLGAQAEEPLNTKQRVWIDAVTWAIAAQGACPRYEADNVQINIGTILNGIKPDDPRVTRRTEQIKWEILARFNTVDTGPACQEAWNALTDDTLLGFKILRLKTVSSPTG